MGTIFKLEQRSSRQQRESMDSRLVLDCFSTRKAVVCVISVSDHHVSSHLRRYQSSEALYHQQGYSSSEAQSHMLAAVENAGSAIIFSKKSNAERGAGSKMIGLTLGAYGATMGEMNERVLLDHVRHDEYPIMAAS